MNTKTQISIEDFGKLAVDMYNSNELNRRTIEAMAEERGVEVPGVIWEQRVSRGVYFVGKIEEDEELSDEELFDVKVTFSETGLTAYIAVTNRKTGQKGTLTSSTKQKSIDKQTDRLKEILIHK